MTLQDRINKYYHDLNGTDKYILKQVALTKPVWEDLTQQRLADLCNASTASIHRMLKRLHFSGFSEFKFFMMNTPPVEEWQETEESYRDFLVNSIDTTLEMNPESTFKELNALFKDANRLYGYGTGTEQREALQSFSNHLMYYHRPITMLNTITDINLMSLRMQPGDVIIITSLSGNTPVIDEIIGILKLKGVVIVSLTNNTRNAIASNSDISFYFHDDTYHGLRSLHWTALTLRVLLDQILHSYIGSLHQ